MKRLLASLILGVVAVGCATTPELRPSTLWIVNARVRGQPGVHSIKVEDGKIVSFDEPVPGARTVDAKNGWVLPGFHDSHVHLLEAGLSKEGVSLGACPTLDAVIAEVASFARGNPAKRWIEGGGWFYSIVPHGRFPTRGDLDRAVADRPVVLSSFDGHTTWANSKALELAGVDAKTADPPGGKIIRDADGSPQGALLESAGSLVYHAVPPLSSEAKFEALRRACDELRRLGVTSIDDIEHDEEVLGLLRALERAGVLPVKIRVGLPLGGDLAHYAELRAKYASDRVQFGFLKGFVDGVVESRTAYLLDPYTGSSERGTPNLPPERLDPLVARAHAAGFPVALHAIGDGAVRISLDAFEAAERAHPEQHLEHRIEHIEVLSSADAPRFAKLGVIASMQPLHAYPEPPTEVWSTNLGPFRLPHTFAWRELLDAKARLVFGSDWPVVSPNPLWGIAVATTRKDRDGQPPGGWNAHQAITVDEALAAYAASPLEVGAPADIVILAPDVELEKAATLWAGKIAATLVDGSRD